MTKMVNLVGNKDYASYLVYRFILTKILLKRELLKYFGSSGVLNLLISSYEKASNNDEKNQFLKAIYLCCREPNNRTTTVQNEHFLDLLLRAFSDVNCDHNILLGIINCFKYNSDATNYLIKHHIISLCIKLLTSKTSFNLPEITSKLLYVTNEVATSVSANTPVSPSTFNGDFPTQDLPTNSSPPMTSEDQIEVVERSDDGCNEFDEESSNEEDVEEEDFLDEDKHLYELAKMFEVNRKNKRIYDRVYSKCDLLDKERLVKKRKIYSETENKKTKLDSSFCLQSTLEGMTSPTDNCTNNKEDEEEGIQSLIINFISHLVGHPSAEKYFNRLESIRTLIYTIPAVDNNYKLAYLLSQVSQNPLYFKLLLSEMLLPMVDLFSKVASQCHHHHHFSLVTNNLSKVFLSRYASTILQELISKDSTRLPCAISLCYLER